MKFLLVNNIPTPYRAYMYETMYRHARAAGVDMQVAFLARREPGRSWDPDKIVMNFPHFYVNDRHGRPYEMFSRWIGGADLFRRIRQEQYDWIWAAPAQSLGNWRLMLQKLPARKVLYSELNPVSARKHYGWRKWIRNRIYNGCDAFVTPGRDGRDFLIESLPAMASRPYFRFSNVVDPRIFDRFAERGKVKSEDLRRKLNLPSGVPVFVSIGAAECKGGLELLKAVENISEPFRIVILGGDSHLARLREAVAESPAGDKFSLPGSVAPATVAEYLLCGDVYLHPALRDCSPLCCVEAAFSGLPMLMSIQSGNSAELIEEGVNGWRFDAFDGEAIAAVIWKALGCSPAQLSDMGRESHRIAWQNFDAGKQAEEFFRWLATCNEKH